ncbi:MAG TPA: methyltransferase domain-containing protein [Bryobacteraceae bacterium]|jgi:ubiquinone/menaquinone biosynthesis C-methylase UbiE
MRVPPLEGHRLWAPKYDEALNPVVTLESRLLADLLCPIAGKCIVDIACGTGRWMTHLCQQGASVFGADASAEMLAQAHAKRVLRGRLALADAASLPFCDRVADVSLCSFAAGYFSSLKTALSEMARITAHGGRVIVSDLHPAGIAAGWTRSFRVHGSVYEMEHLNLSLEEFRAAGRDAGLHLHIQMDASFGDPERLIFKAAGKTHAFSELSRVPAVWIGVWNKP